MRKLSKGFTLIELLIVIAVLGILAVAVLSAINPIEQINRSRDTGSRSDAEQLIGAVDRFYATQGYYPWQTGASDTSSDTGPVQVGTGWVDGASVAVLSKLSETGTGELKASFTTRIQGGTYNKLYVSNDGAAGSSTYVCFVPKSSAFKTEAITRCGAGLPGDYPSDACPTDDNLKQSCLP